jgi:hypothetical protein
LAIRSTAVSSRANRLEAVATLGAAAETTEAAAPEATEAATAAPSRIADTATRGYACEASMACTFGRAAISRCGEASETTQMAKRIDDEDEQKVRAWIRRVLLERYGKPILRLIFAGSRAKGTNQPNSDWDVIAVIEGFRSIWPAGPIRMFRGPKIRAPDGNEVDVLEVNPTDLCHPDAQTNRLIREALALNIDL